MALTRNYRSQIANASDPRTPRVLSLRDLQGGLCLTGNSSEGVSHILQQYFNHIGVMSANDVSQLGREHGAIEYLSRVERKRLKPCNNCKGVVLNGVHPMSRNESVKSGTWVPPSRRDLGKTDRSVVYDPFEPRYRE